MLFEQLSAGDVCRLDSSCDIKRQNEQVSAPKGLTVEAALFVQRDVWQYGHRHNNDKFYTDKKNPVMGEIGGLIVRMLPGRKYHELNVLFLCWNGTLGILT